MRLLDWLRHRGMVGDGSTDHYLRGDMTWNTPPGITGSGNASEYLNGNLAWTVPSGGGTAGDMLSVLTSSEVSVTGATTATISTMHVCSGTSADYTVTLPAASGNTGKFIGFRMATGLTKLVTLDGNASETIDGATTRVMWAGETAILLCDGSNWFKVAGKSKPMVCTMWKNGDMTNFADNSETLITLDATAIDNTGLMASTGSNQITVKRTGNYYLSLAGSWQMAGNAAALIYVAAKVSTTYALAGFGHGVANSYSAIAASKVYGLSSGDVVKLYGFQNPTTGVSEKLLGEQHLTFLSLSEQVGW